MKYAEIVRQDRRLQILLLLQASGGYGASHFLLNTALDKYAHAVSMDALLSDLNFLAEIGLIEIEDMNPAKIARLTQRGLDVATGRVEEPGIKRPQPKA
jgi:hypothetical protein